LVEVREQMPPNAWQRKVSDFAQEIKARGKK